MTEGSKPAIDGDWFEFSFGGKDYAVEVEETIYFFLKIDRTHEEDESECLDCGAKFPLLPEMKAAAHKDRVCPNCSSKSIDWNEAYLDDVADHLVKRVGMPRCSRTEARRFYAAMCEAYEVKKKGSSSPAESPIGTASIQADSAA